MKTGFEDPIAPKIKEKKEKSPWNFDAPQYDERTSCFVSAGSHFGVGYKQPIGHAGDPKSKAPTLPHGRIKTLNLYPNSRNAEVEQD